MKSRPVDMLVKTSHLRDEAVLWTVSQISGKNQSPTQLELEQAGIVGHRNPGGAQPEWVAKSGTIAGYADSKKGAELCCYALKLQGEYMDVPVEVLAPRLCRVFILELRRAVSAENYAEICARNALRDDPLVCHSHDFIDANMVMAAAFTVTTGMEVDTQSDEQRLLWNSAWSQASTEMADQAPVLTAPDAPGTNIPV